MLYCFIALLLYCFIAFETIFQNPVLPIQNQRNGTGSAGISC